MTFASEVQRAAEKERVVGASWDELQAMAAAELSGYMDAWTKDD